MRSDDHRRPHDGSHLSTLEQRLNDGYERIEQALQRGEDVESWTDFWMSLLKEYEEACKVLPEAD